MKAKKAEAKSKWGQYPEPDARRGGCKVSWIYYADEAKAKEASKVAMKNAEVALSEGYDFGFCYPGGPKKMPEGSPYGDPKLSGLYEVCIP